MCVFYHVFSIAIATTIFLPSGHAAILRTEIRQTQGTVPDVGYMPFRTSQIIY